MGKFEICFNINTSYTSGDLFRFIFSIYLKISYTF